MSTTPLPPELRRLRAKAAGLALHAKYGSDEISARARRGFYARFAAQVDPDGTMPAAERERRAEAAMRAHMSSLSYRAARKRMTGR